MTAPHATVAIPPTHGREVAVDRCPWCDQAIPHERFEEIRARLAAAERQHAAEIERQLRQGIAREKAQVEARAKAEIEQAKTAAAAAVARATGEVAVREAKAAAAAKAATEAILAPRIAQAQKAAQQSEQLLATIRANHAKELDERVREQRELLEKASTDRVNAERAKGFKEKLKLEADLQAIQRQLQQKTAAELGEGAEVDLYEDLRRAFPDDRVRRVGKGVAGADIVHGVLHNGRVIGQILYDCKNRASWRNDYVTKLHVDQLAARANHAILSTQVFPSGVRQVGLQDGVIIANPARVVILATMLRDQIVQADAARLSVEEREEKALLLYSFMTSDRCAQLLKQLETVTDDMLELDVTEQKAHSRVWRQRGELLRSSQKAQAAITLEIEQVIGTAAAQPDRP